MPSASLVLLAAAGICLVAPGRTEEPKIEDPGVGSTTALAGTDITLECIVRNLGNHTVLWRRLVSADSTDSELLTVSNYRVIHDKRVAVYHRQGHDTWILQLQQVKGSDSGRYICEVNTIPPLQTYFLVTVIGIQATNTSSVMEHNYTDCCMAGGVSPHCFGYCSLYSLLTGGFYASSPWQCSEHLPTITRCMTDGRDHTPCCLRQKVPEPCRSVCRGTFEVSTVLEHATCAEHTVATLACIAEGIEILPGPPREIVAEALSPTELKITWSAPHQPIPVSHFQINITRLASFDPPAGNAREGKNMDYDPTMQRTVRVGGNYSSYVVQHLEPLTMYEIQLRSLNAQGQSTPSYAVRTLTPPPRRDEEPPASGPTPELPDIAGCCARKGVKADRCRRVLCDPTALGTMQVTDVMICAPWANVTFECLVGGVDHSACCAQRGVPDICVALCSGNVTRLDFRHFICMDYMADFGSCLMDHYGVLPGPPQEVQVAVYGPTWAVVTWKPPTKLANTVRGYVLQWRRLEDVYYNAVPNVVTPYLLDNLQPDTRYEVFLLAINEYGASFPSLREVFSTSPLEAVSPPPGEQGEPGGSAYNETACCAAAGLREHCMPLCSYQVKMSELLLLGPLCTEELPLLVRCGAGGKNHTSCCQRRIVSKACLPLCAGHTGEAASGLGCASDLGKILQCMNEGASLIPEPPVDLHTTEISETAVSLEWTAPNSTVTHYRVLYVPVFKKGSLHPSFYNKSVMVNTTSARVTGLRPNTFYSLYVLAANKHGTSLPSLLIKLHTSSNSTAAKGSLSPPHNVEIPHQTVDSLMVQWQPPIHVPTDAFLNYVVYYLPTTDGGDLEAKGTKLATANTGITLANLSLNTEYAVAVRARTGSGNSDLSETVLAWTDPAIPAMVNPPVIIPAGAIYEGANVTLLCIGMGIPVPLVSLYVNGRMVTQRRQRHVAWEMAHVTRNLTHVACFADNGYGRGAQSSAQISIYFRPSLSTATSTVLGTQGASARLQCVVMGHPKPVVKWFRGDQLISTSNVLETIVEPHPEVRSSYLATLLFKRLNMEDAGTYFCEAENSMGNAKLRVELKVDQRSLNTTGCCRSQGVSEECMDACTFDIDIQLAVGRPQCFPEIHKLMICAADGSDHQQCCRQRGVPRGCLRWCRGNPVSNVPVCILSAATDIVACFEEGKAVLPGQPTNIRSEQIGPHAVRLSWDPPAKNPRLVQWYRVIWRPVGSRDFFRNQTSRRSMDLEGLELGHTYEVVVKAGNHYGMSLHTDPTLVTLNDAQHSSYHVAVHLSLGVLASLLLLGLVVVAFLYLRRYYLRHAPSLPNGGVSFENPTYLKDGGINLQPTDMVQSRAVANIYEEPKACTTSQESSVA